MVRAEILPALTGFRFFLALWVIVFHLSGRGQVLEPAARALPEFFYQWIRGGYLAVTTFFVLSGFVLARSYARTEWTGRNLARYGIGRVARIYPVYALSLAVIAPIIWRDHHLDKAAYTGAYVALTQGWLGAIPVHWNTPAWSLSCEMFFYAMFPLAALLIRKPGWVKTLIAAACATAMTRALWAAGVPDRFKPLLHLSDFLMGIAAACAYDLIGRGRRRPAGMWLYLPAGAASAALIAWPRLLPPGVDLNSALRPLNAAGLIGLALGGGWIARGLSGRAVVYLGKASYAMYILHVPVLWWTGSGRTEWGAALYIAAVTGIAAVVYGAFEEPANRFLRKRLAARVG